MFLNLQPAIRQGNAYDRVGVKLLDHSARSAIRTEKYEVTGMTENPDFGATVGCGGRN
jgi:hypothetical protein